MPHRPPMMPTTRAGARPASAAGLRLAAAAVFAITTWPAGGAIAQPTAPSDTTQPSTPAAPSPGGPSPTPGAPAAAPPAATAAPGTPPGTAAAAVAPPRFPDEYATVPDPHPYLTRYNARDWELQARVLILLDSRLEEDLLLDGDDRVITERGVGRQSVGGQGDDGTDVGDGVIIWPFAIRSSSAETHAEQMFGEFDFNDIEGQPQPPRFLTSFHSDGAYAAWDLPLSRNVRSVDLEVRVQVSAYDTIYHEEAAREVPWPSAWPAVALSTFQPQLFIDGGALVEAGEIDDVPTGDVVGLTLRRWLAGRDPQQDFTPATLARYLAKQVADEIQPRGDGVATEFGGAGLTTISGIDARGAALTLASGRGSPFDMAAALTALYRRAGLPARLVIGYAIPLPFREPGEVLADKTQTARLVPLVEFCLYDEDYNDGQGLITWVPVDIVQVRGEGGATRSLDRPLRFFGNHEGLNDFIPISYHFHPPTNVRAFDFAGLYGIRTEPFPFVGAEQILIFDAIRLPKRNSDVRESERRYGADDLGFERRREARRRDGR